MKPLLTFCFLLACGVCFGQTDPCRGYRSPVTYKFDDTMAGNYQHFSIIRDILSNSHNIWQVGKPQKKVITSAVSLPNVIITDTLKSYPPNDTSTFVFSFLDAGAFHIRYAAVATFSGYYRVVSDSLKDFGTLEYSLDTGKHWIDLLADSVSANWWQTPKPIFTGNSGGWKYFSLNVRDAVRYFPQLSQTNPKRGLVQFKFTFLSDGISDSLDGLAFDNFAICEVVEGIPQIQANALLSLYPNPVTDLLYVERKGALSKGQLQILDGTGRLLFEDRNFTAPSISTKALALPAGLYFLRFTSGETYAVQKFLVAP